MKRVVTIKTDDGDVQVEINAKVTTTGLTKHEATQVRNQIARNLFLAVTEQPVPYTSFGVHNTKVSV